MGISQTEIDNLNNNIIPQMKTDFKDNLNNCNNLLDILSSSTINYNNNLDLYKIYSNDNKELNKKMKTIDSDIVTSDRKTYYENENYDILLFWYKIWKWIYIVFLIIFLIAIFLSNSVYSIWVKIGVFVLFLIYPFVINKIVLYFLLILNNIITLLPKNVYL